MRQVRRRHVGHKAERARKPMYLIVIEIIYLMSRNCQLSHDNLYAQFGNTKMLF